MSDASEDEIVINKPRNKLKANIFDSEEESENENYPIHVNTSDVYDNGPNCILEDNAINDIIPDITNIPDNESNVYESCVESSNKFDDNISSDNTSEGDTVNYIRKIYNGSGSKFNDTDDENKTDHVPNSKVRRVRHITGKKRINKKQNNRGDDDASEESKEWINPYRDSDLYDAEDTGDSRSSNQDSFHCLVSKEPDLLENQEISCNQINKKHSLDKSNKSTGKKKKQTDRSKVSNKKPNKDELLEIRRESQRMVREGRISLPYHQPKQRSLNEFLERRSRLLSIPIKASLDQLHQACEHLEKLEKEVETFFQSDSEDSSSEDKKGNNNMMVNSNENGGISNNTSGVNITDKETDKSTEVTNNDTIASQNENNLDNLDSNNECNVPIFCHIEQNGIVMKFSQTLKTANNDNPLSSNDLVTENFHKTELLANNKHNEVVGKYDSSEHETVGIELENEFGNSKSEYGGMNNIQNDTENSLNMVLNSDTNNSNNKDTACHEENFLMDGCNEIKIQIIDQSCNKQESAQDSQHMVLVDLEQTNKSDTQLIYLGQTNMPPCTVDSEHTDKSQCTIDSEETDKSQHTIDLEQTDESQCRIDSEQSGKSQYTVDSEQSGKSQYTVYSEQTNKSDTQLVDSGQANMSQCTVDSEQADKSQCTIDSEQTVKSQCIENVGTDLRKCDNYISDTNDSLAINNCNKTRYSLANINLYKVPSLKITDKSDSIIEFDCDTPVQPKPGMLEFMERFAKHTAVKPKSDKKKTPVQLSILNTEKDDNGEVSGVNKETFTILLDKDIDPAVIDLKFAKPGAKFAFFKKELQKTMSEKKEAAWNQYQKEKHSYYGDFSESDNEDEFEERNEKKLNFQPAYLMNDLNDEELEEDDIQLVDNENSRNAFVDDEAEESENENYDNDAEADDIDDEVDEVDESPDVDEKCSFGNEALNDDDNAVDNVIGSWHLDSDDALSDKLQQDKHTTTSDSEFSQIINQPQKPFFSIFSKNKCSKNKKNENSTNTCDKLFSSDISGKELEQKVNEFGDTISFQLENSISESQILDICSGQFVSQKVTSNIDYETEVEHFDTKLPDSQDLDSQAITLTLPDIATCQKEDYNSNTLAQHDARFYPSDSENSDNEELFARKRRSKKTGISDDEDEIETGLEKNDIDYNDSDDLNESDSDNNDNAHGDNESDDDMVNNEEDDICYDSEEELVTEKAQQFFEKEAELSESEWGSEDENEKDLDELEEELGDKDDIDTEKVKEELGKIHMRQLLDDDQKDVRLLQEMLLDDGELHSDTKRHRKFQWKNADGDDYVSVAFDDSDVEHNSDNEEEMEANWRRIRHEREIFLSRQEENNVLLHDDLEEEDSQILMLGRKHSVLLRQNSVDVDAVSETAATNIILSPNPKHHNSKLKCGSFLSRGELLLSRIAVSTSCVKETVGNRPKNNRNFVFGAISPTKKLENEYVEEKAEKRKNVSASYSVKRLKMSSELSPCASDSSVNKKSLLRLITLNDM